MSKNAERINLLSRTRPGRRVIFLALFLSFLLQGALSQGRWCAVEGTVTDPSGAPLKDAEVIVSSVGRGLDRSTTTSATGYFRVPLLEPGEYRLTARKGEFATARAESILLNLNQLSRVDLQLSVEGISSTVEVIGRISVQDTSLSGLSSLVDEQHVVELPLNGRDYIQLSLLHAGVHVAGAQSRNFNTGQGIQLSISGSRPVQNGFYLDGIAVSDQTGSTPGSLNGLNFGVDAVQEFSILTSSYSAQQGNAAGGILQAVTRSGSNSFHGGLFYFHRGDNLDARSFFDPGRPPEFRRHHFGGSLGGPIVQNRTFFFLNPEWLRQVRGISQIDTALSREARQGNLVEGTVPVDPAIARVLELYPLPNGTILGDTGLFLFPNDLQAEDFFLTSRIDHTFSDSDQIFGRYTVTDSRLRDETTFALNERLNASRQQSMALEETHIFSPRMIQSSRFGFSRTYTANNLTTTQVPGADDPDLGFLPDSHSVGIIDVPGLSLFPGGTRALDADLAAFNLFQFFEDLTFERGSHSIHFGFALLRSHLNIDSESLQSGEYRFSSIEDFLTNQPSRFLAQLPGSDTIRGFRQWTFAWYLTESWRFSPRLSVDLGVRHEWTTVPTEVNGKLANLDELRSPEVRVGSPLYENPSLLNLGPRVGLAWDFSGSGRTLLRTGYGIFYDQLGLHYLLLAGLRNPPFLLRASIRDLPEGAFPKGGYDELIAAPTLDLRVERIPRNLEQPYVQQWNVTVHQALARRASMRLAYVGSRGVNLSTIVEDANLVQAEILEDGRFFFPEDGTNINPNFGQIRDRSFHGSSFYHALQSELRWQAGSISDLLVSYTFSRSVDDSSTTFAQTESSNAIGIPVNGDSRFNRGLSNHDRRHRFVTSLLWHLPSPPDRRLGWLFGNWRASLVCSYDSGLPFSATLRYDAARTGTSRPDYRGGQRPNLAPGFGANPVTGDPNGWFTPEAFARPQPGFVGNLGRNTMIGPNNRNVDLALVKRFGVPLAGNDGQMDFRIEFFNLLNNANFDLPDPRRQEVFTASGIPEDVGRITSAAPGREIQVGLKLSF